MKSNEHRIETESLPRQWVKGMTGFAEFLTDHMAGTSGHILVKASPLMAPLPSAIFIFIALLRYANGNPWLIAAAAVLTFVTEGLGYSAVHARNQIEDHNRRSPGDRVDANKAITAVRVYFIVTEAIILGFETIPAWIEWGTGAGDLTHAIIATVILIFPVFSYVGSNIYSLMDILTTIRHKADARVDDMIHDLRQEIAKLQQALADAETRRKNELAEMAKRGEIATGEKLAILTQQLEDRHRADMAAMAAELKILRRQQERQDRQPAIHRQPNGGGIVTGELSEVERQRCAEVAKFAVGMAIRTWEDLEAASGWAKKTAQRYGKLAKDAGYIAKDSTGVYRPTQIATIPAMGMVTTNGYHA